MPSARLGIDQLRVSATLCAEPQRVSKTIFFLMAEGPSRAQTLEAGAREFRRKFGKDLD